MSAHCKLPHGDEDDTCILSPASFYIQPAIAYYNRNEISPSVASATWPVDKPDNPKHIENAGLFFKQFVEP